jgi:hypothetical protein
MTDRDKRIMAMFTAGFAPSEIDKGMGLFPGTAHMVVVAAWAHDKKAAWQDRVGEGWTK